MVSQPKFAIYCSLKPVVTEICRQLVALSQLDHNDFAGKESSSAFHANCALHRSSVQSQGTNLVGHELLHEFFIHIEIGENMLDVVVVLQHVEQLQELFCDVCFLNTDGRQR